ncbi:MAG: hypothetical protein JO197_09685 [Acidobacteria bacterium]|nr:hypothetical protein [Acidobacteriota bacterium]MBV9477367.1 hypothetical protein [Acidobacteriota bacterium]
MLTVAIVLFFVTTLLIVQVAIRNRPLKLYRPLDDDDVPFPAAGQASTVFSLAALFGCYPGIFLLIGGIGFVGVAGGSAAALLLIRAAQAGHEGGYETFLEDFRDRFRDTGTFFFALFILQIGFAISELVFLRVVLLLAFGLSPSTASYAALAVAVVGYCYCLTGGYNTVFRTDIVQLLTVAGMCLLLLGALATSLSLPEFLTAAGAKMVHHGGYWTAGFFRWSWVERILDFSSGFLLGFAFLLVSPDTWKRVYIVSRVPSRRGISLLFVAAAFPFVAITPLVLALPNLPHGVVDPTVFLQRLAGNRILLGATLIGVFASFLSSFDSALIAATHVSLLSARRARPALEELDRFRYLAALHFVIVSLVFVIGSRFGNPGIMATILMGTYPVLGGLLIGTRAGTRNLPSGAFGLVFLLGCVAWIVFTMSDEMRFEVGRTTDLNFVPAAGCVLLASAAMSWILSWIPQQREDE